MTIIVAANLNLEAGRRIAMAGIIFCIDNINLICTLICTLIYILIYILIWIFDLDFHMDCFTIDIPD